MTTNTGRFLKTKKMFRRLSDAFTHGMTSEHSSQSDHNNLSSITPSIGMKVLYHIQGMAR
jgi:hypothetical protein